MDWDWKKKESADRYNEHYEMPAADAERYLRLLALDEGDAFVDFGCGRGDMLALAAPRVNSALGLDVSPQQLALARERLRGFDNVQLEESSFEAFRPGGRRFTKGFARKALHHLDDGGKTEFFRRVGPAFEAGGVFLLEDAVYDFDRGELESRMPGLLKEMEAYFGAQWAEKKDDVLHMLRHEFPTGYNAWTAALEAGGFRVVERRQKTSFIAMVFARRC